MKEKDGGPAFPNVNDMGYGDLGMSLRAYAAIKLKQPESGIDWLDEMILKAKRDELAAKAMQGMISAHDQNGEWTGCGDIKTNEILSETAYSVADAMLKAGKE